MTRKAAMMSFLKNLLGGTFETHKKQGDALFETGRYGEAKISYDRALSRAKNIDQSQLDAVRNQLDQCRIQLARARLAEADELARHGEIEEAMVLLSDISEICSDPQILSQVQERRDSYESEDVRRLVDENQEIDEDELLAILGGTWTEQQADEYAALPETMREAILCDHDGDSARAAELIEGIVARDDLPLSPCYAWFELGRCRLRAGDHAGALKALDIFLERVESDPEGLGHAVAANQLRARALVSMEEFEPAKDALLRNTKLAPEDHTTFLSLGVFLRDRGEYDPSLRALERAVELMGQMQPDFRVIRELGFTYLAMDRKREAMKSLGAVIEHLASRGEHNQFDPETTVTLAKLHEEMGSAEEAADLYRHLAVGYDTANHFIYNLEAARLLQKSGGQPELIDRYLTRAGELAQDEEQRDILQKIRNQVEKG